MAANDDVLIVGKLDSKELEKSINDLIDFVGDKTTIMAGKFDSAMDKMKSAMKDFAITQKVSVDLMKEAWKDMSASFDAMVAAQSGATGGGKGKEPREYAPNTIGALEQEIEKRQQNRKEMELDSDALRQENKLIEERNKKLAEQKGLNTMAAQAKKAGEEIRVAFSHPANSLEQAEAKLAKLKALAANWKGKGVLDETQWNKIQNAINRTEKSIEKFKMSAMTLKDLKLLPEKSVDDITKKLQALKHIQIDPKNATQVKKLGDEYQRLSRMQNELLGRSIQLTKSNNYLAQSFGYIRNRIVYALTLGAATSFVKQVYDIRAQYELLERSLGVLIGSFERGSRIFQELNTMALKSPFTLMELGTAAKQLTAYNFQANEVVNTTRRLADLSAALGVPMERLTYNLGQIRAQTVLTARDARDFANAGLPIVKSLADHFSELEGRVVSTGDVYDRMSKKAVSYNDVMAVLNKMTDEGGKFFDFQAKQAETLRVQLANLTLAWNNMLNAVGKENQGMLTLPITALKSLFQNWKELSHVITEVVIALGLYKGTQLVVNKLVGESAMVMRKSILMDKEKAASELQREGTVRRLLVSEQKQIANKKKVVAADYQAILSTRELSKTQALLLAAFNKNDKELMKALVKLKLLKQSEIENITVGKAFSLVIKQMGISLASLGKTIAMFLPQMAAMAAIGAIVEAVYTFSEISDKIRDINKSIVDSAKESADSIAQFMKDYSETYKKVFEYQEKAQKNGVPATATKDGIPQYKNLNDAEALKAWDAIREQIELTSAASGVFIDKLMQINDVNDRVRAGFNYLQQIHDINGALESLDDKAVTINGDWSKWWNLWSLPDGLIDNLKDYSEQLDKVIEKWGSLANAKEAAMRKQDGAEGDLHDVQAQFTTFSNDLKDTISSMFNAFSSVGINTAEGMREAFERSNNQILADANLSSKEQLQYRMAAEEEFIAQRKAQFKEEYDFEIEQGNAARAARVKEEEAAWLASFGSGKAVSQAFFDWLKNQHASEINSMFGKMSRRELEQMDWSQPKWQKWAQDNAESFSKQYGISFDKLKGLVADANTWKIFLKLTITTDEKSVYDTLKDADAAANAAWTKIQRLKQRQAELNKIPATSLTEEQNEEAKNLVTELTQAQNDYNDAVAKGGHASKQAKANAKAQKTAEQEVNEALRQELSIIREVQSNYDKLRKSGVDDMQAAQLAAQGYADTLSRVNNILAKYGISKFNAKDFAGKDTRAILETLQKQRNDLIASGKVKTAGLKDMDVEIQKLTVDAKTYDMKKVTDGLNSELGKIKDEYELSVELDANPELGNMFAELFGIDTTDFPRTIDEVMSRAQKEFDKARFDLNLGAPLNIFTANTEKWYNWGKAVGYSKEQVDNFKKSFDGSVGIVKKWAQDIVKQTQDLQYKLADNNGKIAIEEEKLANLRQRLAQETNDEQRRLLELQIQDQQNAIAKLKEEILQLLPTYQRVFGEVAEHSAYMTRKLAKDYKNMLVEGKNRGLNADNTYSVRDPITGQIARITKERMGKEIKNADKELQKTQSSIKKITEAFKKGEDGVVDWVHGIELIGQELGKLGQFVDVVGNIVDAFGNPNEYNETAEAIHDIAASLQGVSTAAQGIGQIASGDYIGGAVSVASGLFSAISTWFDNGDKEVLQQIKESERAVNRLELAYIDLEHAVKEAYGMATIGANMAAKANKELQLVELKRQLALERSRDSKHRDEDKIIDLQKQIKELEYDIQDTVDSIVNNLLGISSVGDAMENMMDAFIEALRSGEDAMATFDENVDEMIANMVKKMFTTKILQPWFDEQWNKIQEQINQRAGDIPERLAKAQSKVSEAKMADLDDNDSLVGALRALGMSDDQIHLLNWYNEFGQNDLGLGRNARLRAAYEKMLKEAEQKEIEMQKELTTATMPTTDDIRQYAELLRSGQPIMEENMQEVANFLRELGLMKDDANKNLSALQQGIAGVSEETASAVEAYLNGMSQQAYLRNDLLVQIRDTIMSFDMDVQLGVFSQMLLQLQNNYIVMQSMQSMMEGWTTPSGQGIRVELIS